MAEFIRQGAREVGETQRKSKVNGYRAVQGDQPEAVMRQTLGSQKDRILQI